MGVQRWPSKHRRWNEIQSQTHTSAQIHTTVSFIREILAVILPITLSIERYTLSIITFKFIGSATWGLKIYKKNYYKHLQMSPSMESKSEIWTAPQLNQNWACFVSYLNNMKTLLKNNMIILKQIVWETQKGIKILVSPVVLKLLIETGKNIVLINNTGTV